MAIKRPDIVWASVLVLAYELFALRTHRCDPWTALAERRAKRSVVIWVYWLWLGVHLITGGKI